MLSDGRGGFVAAAIFGLVVISAGFGAYVTNSFSRTNPYPPFVVVHAGEGRASALRRNEQRRPCVAMVGNDDANLCARWRTVDATEHAAFWTFVQMLLGGLGLIGLFLTLWYNRRAISIADETQREGQRIGQASVRCYLDIRRVCLSLSKDGVPSISLRLRNDGASPARDITVHTAVKFSVLAEDYTRIFKSRFPRKIPMLGVGRTLKMTRHPSARGISKRIHDAIEDETKKVGWWAIVEVKFTDVFENTETFRRMFAGPMSISRDMDLPTFRADEMDAKLRAEVIRRQHLGTWEKTDY